MNEPLERLRRHFSGGRTRPIPYRIEQLRSLGAAIRAKESRILQALREDLGRPPFEAYTSEVYFTLKEIDLAVRRVRRWARPRRVRGNLIAFPSSSWIRPDPYGVALVIAPWNYPLTLLISPMVSAIAAGNCVVAKPSELAPATSAVTRELVEEALDPSLVAVFEGGPDVARALLAERFDFIFYTGGERVGRLVLEAAARQLTPAAVELGGKCPAIVDARVDVRRAARRIALGKFMNAGQTCLAPDFVCADESIRGDLSEAIRGTIREFYGAEPRRSPDYARIINRRHFDRLLALAQDAGCCVGSHDAESLIFAPAILDRATWEDPAMAEEIFGPILPIVGYRDVAEVIEELARRPRPLAVYIFSGDRAFQERVIGGTHSGGVCINDTILQATNLNLPFGGVGASGMGRYHGRFGFETFSHERAIMRRWLRWNPFAAYPPYGTLLDRVRRFLR